MKRSATGTCLCPNCGTTNPFLSEHYEYTMGSLIQQPCSSCKSRWWQTVTGLTATLKEAKKLAR